MKLINKHLVEFLIFSFGITFLLQGVMIVANQYGVLKFGSATGTLIYVLSTLAPTIVSGYILVKNKYIVGIKGLFRRMFQFRASIGQYAMVFLFIVLQYCMVLFCTPLKEGSNLLFIPIMIVPCIFDGGLEEVAWRFILGPTLEAKMNYIVATVITSLIWCFWHIFHFLIVGTGQYDTSLGLFYIFVLGASFSLSAIFRVTQNVWLCTLCHATINAMSFCWGILSDWNITLFTTIIIVCVSIIIVYVNEHRKSVS